MPYIKEPHYFSHTEDVSFGIKSLEDYLDLFSKAKAAKAVGEASVMYLYSKNASVKIKKTLGNKVKIIIILRDPVQMIYSLWRHNVRYQIEHLSFEEALAEEKVRFNLAEFRANNTQPAVFFYCRRALFVPQIRRYLEQFSHDNVLLVRFDDLRDFPEDTYRSILEFLGLEWYEPSSYDAKNIGGTIRSQKLHDILFNPDSVCRLPFKIFPKKFRRYLWVCAELFNRKPGVAEKLDPEIELKLREFFLDDINELEKITGWDLSKWKFVD